MINKQTISIYYNILCHQRRVFEADIVKVLLPNGLGYIFHVGVYVPYISKQIQKHFRYNFCFTM